ncbi:MAG: thioredoxin domain-containing protein, partial [Acidimicrobiales bacterium]
TMSGNGGWPMTVFLAPDGRPFFGGTYFPPEARHGLPGFVELCHAVEDAWRDRRGELEGQADRLTESVGRMALLRPSAEPVERGLLDGALSGLLAQHDTTWGGFGGAPKFPQEVAQELLLRLDGDAALGAVTTTLDAMVSGGIWDHLGGGFARYSVDARWLVPHFEKMLYNQALMARVALHAWQRTGEPRYRAVLDETLAYVLRDLRLPEGGFSSAEDADSEGEEGRFYVWRASEIESILGADLARAAIRHWGVTAEGNFERGTNILHLPAGASGILRPPEVETARGRLFEARAARVRPGLDDKVLTEWNGLLLATLAEAGAATGHEPWIEAAREGADFLLGALRRAGDRRWLRSWQRDLGASRYLAYAADHAAMVDAFTRLAEATGRARWIAAATETADAMLELFWDGEAGGLFTTGHDAERLIARTKDVVDHATPSANALAAVALLRLGALVGRSRYVEAARSILELLGEPARRQPSAFCHLLLAVDLDTAPMREIVIPGDGRPDLVAVVHSRFLPDAVLAWGERYPSPLFEGRDDGMAYVCERYSCRRPVSSAGDLAEELSRGRHQSPRWTTS